MPHGHRRHIVNKSLWTNNILQNVLFITALSTLQNGKIPKFLEEDVLKELVSADPPSSACIRNLRKGLDALGMYKVHVYVAHFLSQWVYLFV